MNSIHMDYIRLHKKSKVQVVVTLTMITTLLVTSIPTAMSSEWEPPQLFFYVTDIETNNTEMVKQGFHDIRNPSLHKDHFVFVYDNISSRFEISFSKYQSKIAIYNLSTNKLNNIGYGNSPKIYDNIVVYGFFDENKNPNQIIKIYDINTKDTITIEGNKSFYSPKIYNNTIIWLGGNDVYLYNLTTGNYSIINSLSSLNVTIIEADIFSDVVVIKTVNNLNSDTFYLYNITKSELIKVDTNNKYVSFQFGQNYLVWSESDGINRSTAISILNLTSMSKFTITEAPLKILKVSENNILWATSSWDGYRLSLANYNITSKSQTSIELNDFYWDGYWNIDIDGLTILWVGTPLRPPIDNPTDTFLSFPSLPQLIIAVIFLALLGNRQKKKL